MLNAKFLWFSESGESIESCEPSESVCIVDSDKFGESSESGKP